MTHCNLDSAQIFSNYYNTLSKKLYFVYTYNDHCYLFCIDINSKKVDTIANLNWYSYNYNGVSYSALHNKFITSLNIGEWQSTDLLNCKMYYSDLLVIAMEAMREKSYCRINK